MPLLSFQTTLSAPLAPTTKTSSCSLSVHGGQWRTWRCKPGIGQADRRMPGAVMILPDDVEDAVRIDSENFQVLVERLVHGGNRRGRRQRRAVSGSHYQPNQNVR